VLNSDQVGQLGNNQTNAKSLQYRTFGIGPLTRRNVKAIAGLS